MPEVVAEPIDDHVAILTRVARRIVTAAFPHTDPFHLSMQLAKQGLAPHYLDSDEGTAAMAAVASVLPRPAKRVIEYKIKWSPDWTVCVAAVCAFDCGYQIGAVDQDGAQVYCLKSAGPWPVWQDLPRVRYSYLLGQTAVGYVNVCGRPAVYRWGLHLLNVSGECATRNLAQHEVETAYHKHYWWRNHE